MKNNSTIAIDNSVSISKFNQGKVGKIFVEVQKTGTKAAEKNNKTEVIIISPDDYSELRNQIEDTDSLKQIYVRLVNFNRNLLKTEAEIFEDLNISEEDLGEYMDVELD